MAKQQSRGKYANFILVNRAWNDTRSVLTTEQKAEAFDMIFEVGNGGDYTAKDKNLDLLFTSWKQEIRQQMENYQNVCDARSAAKKKTQCTNDTNVTNVTNAPKEGRKEGRMERRTEGLLSNPSGLERSLSADAPPVGGTPQTEDDPRDGMTEEQRNAYELKLHYDELNDMDLSEEE